MRTPPRAPAPRALATCMLVACVLATTAITSTAAAATVHIVRNVPVPTADGGSFPVDVWRPRPPAKPATKSSARRAVVKPRPVALLVHGGGWHTGDKRQWEQSRWAQRLAARGWLVVNANYRLACAVDGTTADGTLGAEETAASARGRDGRSARVVRDPKLCGHALDTSMLDVREALRYTSLHAKAWGGDPSRIVLFGASAGGHLAMLAASDRSRPRGVRAVVALSPPTDLMAVGADPTLPLYGSARQAIGCDLAACPETWRLASPIARVRRGFTPPTLVFDAGADPITPLANAAAYVDRLHVIGVDAALVTTADPEATCHGPIPCEHAALSGTRLGLFDQSVAWLRART